MTTLLIALLVWPFAALALGIIVGKAAKGN